MNPVYAGNLGAVARLVANFGVDDVVYVSEQTLHQSMMAEIYAVGCSKEELSRFRRVGTMEEALEGVEWAIAFSKKEHRHVERERTLPEWVSEFRGLLERRQGVGSVGLVFGKETHGLTERELEACHREVSIPVTTRLGSMNLSHSIAVVLARVFEVLQGYEERPREQGGDRPRMATAAELERLKTHLYQTIVESPHFSGANPYHMLDPMLEVLRRAEMTHREFNYFRAFVARVRAGNKVLDQDQEKNLGL